MGRVSTPPEQRFWPHVDRKGPSECWRWIGSLDSRGYGSIYRGGEWLGAHRLSWQIANEQPVPDGMVICHACDNPQCVNPSHLWAGSQADNARDMYAKGRGRNQKKTHCKRGHEFTVENTRTTNGVRVCRACGREAARERAIANGTARLPNKDKTNCKFGHPFDASNTYFNSNGSRHCRACNTRRAAERRRLNRNAESKRDVNNGD